MRKSRFTEAQIIGMIKEQEAGMPTAELCRKHGLSPGTFYKFKSKYGGMEVSDAAKLRALEDENARLKRLRAFSFPESGLLFSGSDLPRPCRTHCLKSPFPHVVSTGFECGRRGQVGHM